MKRVLVVVGLLWACAASAQYVMNGNPTAGGQPVSGRTPAGKGQELAVTDGGAVYVSAAATNGSTHMEVCALNTYDATKVSDGGTAAVSVFTPPTGTRAILIENEGPNYCRITVDGRTPTDTTVGMRIAALGAGATAVPDRIAIDCETGACASVKVKANTADQSSGACLQVTTLR